MAWQIHKFGGSSLADAERFRRVAGIVEAEAGSQAAVVVSAMGGMTDGLLRLVKSAERSASDIPAGLDEIAARYRGTATELLSEPPLLEQVLDTFEADVGDAADVLHAVSLVRSAADRSRDLIAGYGEIWSARLLAALLEQRGTLPVAVGWLDARRLIVVEHGEMGPVVQWDRSRRALDEVLDTRQAGVFVVTGFIASDRDGLHTTLGRNGSDFSASILGALLDAERISIWTDVNGVMSADPGRVPEARVIDELSYNEAMELAYFGARVIHPQTMSPAVTNSIPIWIRNTFNPGAPGSHIGPTSSGKLTIKGVTSVDDVALVNLEGAGMIGVPGTADRLFGALRRAGISVVLISQASSEHSICFAVPDSSAERTRRVVSEAFSGELADGQIQRIDVQPNCCIVAVVGDGMTGEPGVAGRFFGTLGDAGINVRAIAQGSSERNISAVISNDDSTRALRAAHSGFYLSARTVSLGVIGPGNVGGTLLDQMAGQVGHLRAEFGLEFRIRGIMGSHRMYLAEHSVDLARWRDLYGAQSEPADWDKFEAHVNPDHLPHAAMVDCTASGDVADRYADWFEAGIHVVTPNKRANSGTYERYELLHSTCRRHNTHFLYETTVGAGLPVIHTLKDLRATGDHVTRVEGVLSGTLAYIFNRFDGSQPFSEIVREAHSSGYTEPDPREDLSGMDVARKLVIVARELGHGLELDAIPVESLVPPGLESGDAGSFLDRLPEFDAVMEERWRSANNTGRVLRYVASLDPDGEASVKLESLDGSHAFAHMNLTDNILRIASQRYSDNPLIVQGPGAGPDVTAAGVFADLLRLAAFLGAR